VHSLSTFFVLGYHGCDRSIGEQLLNNNPFEPSNNTYDWLGAGVYFWESNPERALLWARNQAQRGRIHDPYVVGAVIDLGFCLDLTTSNGIRAVQVAYTGLRSRLEKTGIPLPQNRDPESLDFGDREDSDRVLRELDCAVINYLHQVREESQLAHFDSVRGLFPEGGSAFDGSMFMEMTHTQICVRNQENVHGVFRVHERYFSRIKPESD